MMARRTLRGKERKLRPIPSERAARLPLSFFCIFQVAFGNYSRMFLHFCTGG